VLTTLQVIPSSHLVAIIAKDKDHTKLMVIEAYFTKLTSF
jgi:hypothetical protein